MAKKKKKKNKGPSEPAPLNVSEITQQGQQAAQVNLDQLRGFYGQLASDIGNRHEAISALRGANRGLQSSDYLYAMAGQTRQSAAEAAERINMLGGRMLGVADQIDTRETGLESELRRQAQEDLALGRSLSPEQMRDATQSARQAFAARGLGTGMGAAAAELLNRDRFATQRQNERRAFALGTNQNIEGTLGARRALAGDMLGQTANAYQAGGQMRLAGDQAGAGMMEASGNMGLNTARSFTQQNPYVLAMGGLGSGAGMIQTGSKLAADAASFNTNMQASMYNSYQNNQAAMESARMQSSALGQQGMMGMIGGIGGGALAGAGAAYGGMALAGAAF